MEEKEAAAASKPSRAQQTVGTLVSFAIAVGAYLAVDWLRSEPGDWPPIPEALARSKWVEQQISGPVRFSVPWPLDRVEPNPESALPGTSLVEGLARRQDGMLLEVEHLLVESGAPDLDSVARQHEAELQDSGSWRRNYSVDSQLVEGRTLGQRSLAQTATARDRYRTDLDARMLTFVVEGKHLYVFKLRYAGLDGAGSFPSGPIWQRLVEGIHLAASPGQ
jgi:hypothetical protein